MRTVHENLNMDNSLKKDEKNPLFKYTIRYDEGITADHVIASGSFPVNFEYCKILVENNHTGYDFFTD